MLRKRDRIKIFFLLLRNSIKLFENSLKNKPGVYLTQSAKEYLEKQIFIKTKLSNFDEFKECYILWPSLLEEKVSIYRNKQGGKTSSSLKIQNLLQELKNPDKKIREKTSQLLQLSQESPEEILCNIFKSLLENKSEFDPRFLLRLAYITKEILLNSVHIPKSFLSGEKIVLDMLIFKYFVKEDISSEKGPFFLMTLFDEFVINISNLNFIFFDQPTEIILDSSLKSSLLEELISLENLSSELIITSHHIDVIITGLIFMLELGIIEGDFEIGIDLFNERIFSKEINKEIYLKEIMDFQEEIKIILTFLSNFGRVKFFENKVSQYYFPIIGYKVKKENLPITLTFLFLSNLFYINLAFKIYRRTRKENYCPIQFEIILSEKFKEILEAMKGKDIDKESIEKVTRITEEIARIYPQEILKELKKTSSSLKNHVTVHKPEITFPVESSKIDSKIKESILSFYSQLFQDPQFYGDIQNQHQLASEIIKENLKGVLPNLILEKLLSVIKVNAPPKRKPLDEIGLSFLPQEIQPQIEDLLIFLKLVKIPSSIKNDIQKYYQLQARFFDYTSDILSLDKFPSSLKQRLERIVEKAQIKPESVILDVGAGTGVLFAYFAKHKPSKVITSEVSEGMIKKLKENYQKLKSRFGQIFELEIYQKDITLLLDKLRENSIDYIFFNAVWPNLKEKEKIIEKAFRVLKGNGKIIISHPEGKEFVNNRLRHFLPFLIDKLPERGEIKRLIRKLPLEIEKFIDENIYFVFIKKVSISNKVKSSSSSTDGKLAKEIKKQFSDTSGCSNSSSLNLSKAREIAKEYGYALVDDLRSAKMPDKVALIERVRKDRRVKIGDGKKTAKLKGVEPGTEYLRFIKDGITTGLYLLLTERYIQLTLAYDETTGELLDSFLTTIFCSDLERLLESVQNLLRLEFVPLLKNNIIHFAKRKWIRNIKTESTYAHLLMKGKSLKSVAITKIYWPVENKWEHTALIYNLDSKEIEGYFYGKITPERLKRLANHKICNFTLNSRGQLYLGGKIIFQSSRYSKAVADIIVKNGVPIKIIFKQTKDGFPILNKKGSSLSIDLASKIPIRKQLEGVTISQFIKSKDKELPFNLLVGTLYSWFSED
ncbi:hypothetical protein DRN69_06715, partial [Candidatus Pacearchaeota archaeon]